MFRNWYGNLGKQIKYESNYSTKFIELFQTFRNISVPRTHHQNFSLQFKINLLEEKTILEISFQSNPNISS
jgi:hypothetical protein